MVLKRGFTVFGHHVKYLQTVFKFLYYIKIRITTNSHLSFQMLFCMKTIDHFSYYTNNNVLNLLIEIDGNICVFFGDMSLVLL